MTSTPITLATLQAGDFYKTDIEAFREAFPDGIPSDKQAALAIALEHCTTLDFDWVARFLSPVPRIAYYAATAEAKRVWRACMVEPRRALDATKVEPLRVQDAAIAEAHRIYRAARAEAQAQPAYDVAMAEAQRIYRAARAEAINTYSIALAEPRRAYDAALRKFWRAFDVTKAQAFIDAYFWSKSDDHS